MRRLFFALFLPSLCRVLAAQPDSLVYEPERGVQDGVYLSYRDFRYNREIKKEQIQSDHEKNQLDFLSRVLSEERLVFRRNDSIMSIPASSVWGYFQNNALYIYFRNDFYRVPVFGAICYLVANVTVPGSVFYDGRFGSGVATGHTEVREFLMDFYSGQVREFDRGAFEELLARDPALFQEYRKLPRRRRQESRYRFIRKFNEKHPVYFLVP